MSAAADRVTIYEHNDSAVATLVRGNDAGIGRCLLHPDETATELRDRDVVKVDVEGVEVDILRGRQEPLSRRIAHMIVEFTNEAVLDQARRLLPLHEFRQLDDRHWVLR